MHKLTTPFLLMGGSSDMADVRYATGFTAPDPFLFLEHGNQHYLLVSPLEYGRATETATNCRVLLPKDLPISKAEQRRMSGGAWGLLRMLGRHDVRVSANFPVAIARRLEQKGVRVQVMTAGPYPQRELKTQKEITQIAAAQRAAAAGIEAAAQQLRMSRLDRAGFVCRGRKKITSEDLRLIIEMELLRHHCNPGETIVASGPMSANPHERGSGPIRAGTPIIIDIFPSCKVSGYFGDITRTFCKGHAPDALRRMVQAVQAAQRMALKTLRAGVALATPHKRVVDYFERLGFKTEFRNGVPCGFIHGLGHGVGLEIHEAPSLSSRSTGRLRVGHVVTVEPGLYDPSIGGVRFEDTVAMTANGWRPLATCEVPWEV